MYKHTQSSSLMVILPVVAGAVILVYIGATQSYCYCFALAGVLLVVALLFRSMTVTVDSDFVNVRFGTGLIWFTYPVGEIMSAKPVRNNPLYGWGIRLIPGGWLFNVWGLDAVELRLHDGRMRRIGTDEPESLSRAIHSQRCS